MSDQTCTKCDRQSHRLTRSLCDNCYFTVRYRAIGYGKWQTIYIDAEPARQRIVALRDLGIGFRTIAALTDIRMEVLRGVAVGRGGRPPVKRIKIANADRILAIEIPTGPDLYRLAAPGARVPITGTRRRLQSLMHLGYSQTYLSGLISDSQYAHRTLWTNKNDRTTAAVAVRVVEIFDELQLTPGPSLRARNWAIKNGWPHPLQWDEESLDDPNGSPCIKTARRATVLEQYDELVAIGVRDINIIAERIGAQPKSIERALLRRKAAA